MPQQKKSLIFLDKNRIDFFEEGGNNIYHIDLSPQSVSDLEIVSSDTLTGEITTFLTTNKIIPSHALIILSESILFQKDFPPKAKEEDPDPELLIKHYIDNIPFENTVSKTIDLQGGVKKVIAANKDFFDTVQSIFKKNKFSIQSVVLGLEIPGFQPGSLTSEGIGAAFKHFDSYKIGTFEEIKPQEKKGSEEKSDSKDTDASFEVPEDNNDDQKKTERKRQFILLGVFGVLILILAGVSIKTFVLDANKTTPPPSSQPIENTTVTTAPTPTIPLTLPTPSTEQIQNTSIQILNGSGIPGQASALENTLTTLGFQNVTVGNTSAPAPTNTIILSSELPEEVKIFLTQEIQKTYPSITVREATGTSFDAVITIVSEE